MKEIENKTYKDMPYQPGWQSLIAVRYSIEGIQQPFEKAIFCLFAMKSLLTTNPFLYLALNLLPAFWLIVTFGSLILLQVSGVGLSLCNGGGRHSFPHMGKIKPTKPTAT